MQPRDENNPNREIHEEIRTESANGQVNSSRTTSSVPTKNSADSAHHSGYIQGAISENIRQENQANGQKVRDNDNAGRGLLIGIIMAAVAALVLTSVYFLNRRDPSPLIVPVPSVDRSTPPSIRTIEKEKTIIERTEKAAPTPQSSSNQNSKEKEGAPAPNVNITIPNSQPQNATPQVAPTSPSNNINISVPNSNDKEPLLTPPAPQSPTPNLNAPQNPPQNSATPVNPPVPTNPPANPVTPPRQ